MTQAQLDHHVAAATGESRRTIGSLGFSIADPLEVHFDPEPANVAKFLDWDQVARRRHSRLSVFYRLGRLSPNLSIPHSPLSIL